MTPAEIKIMKRMQRLVEKGSQFGQSFAHAVTDAFYDETAAAGGRDYCLGPLRLRDGAETKRGGVIEIIYRKTPLAKRVMIEH